MLYCTLWSWHVVAVFWTWCNIHLLYCYIVYTRCMLFLDCKTKNKKQNIPPSKIKQNIPPSKIKTKMRLCIILWRNFWRLKLDTVDVWCLQACLCMWKYVYCVDSNFSETQWKNVFVSVIHLKNMEILLPPDLADHLILCLHLVNLIII